MSVCPSLRVRRRRDEEKTAYRDVKLGLDKLDGPVNVKPIALERLIIRRQGDLVLPICLGDTRMTFVNSSLGYCRSTMVTSISYYLKKGTIHLGQPETLKSLMVFSVSFSYYTVLYICKLRLCIFKYYIQLLSLCIKGSTREHIFIYSCKHERKHKRKIKEK